MKPFSEFSKSKGSPKNLCYWCKLCCAENARKHNTLRRNDPKYRLAKRRDYIKNRHGLTLQQYEEKLVAQSNKCAICDIALLPNGFGTHLDHDHKTGYIRAFLCTNCNRGLGHFQDNKTFLTNAAKYLETHNGNVDSGKEVTDNDGPH